MDEGVFILGTDRIESAEPGNSLIREQSQDIAVTG